MSLEAQAKSPVQWLNFSFLVGNPPGRFQALFEVKMTKCQEAQQSFWKSSELSCVSLLSSYEAPKLIFDHLLFVLFLIFIAH